MAPVAHAFSSGSFTVARESTLERALREHYAGASWNAVRRLVQTGKVQVDGRLAGDPQMLLGAGGSILVSMSAPAPGRRPAQASDILFVDRHVVVVSKPAGISSVRHESEPTSMQERVSAALSAAEGRRVGPLRVVHRLDKVTSGVMVFARTVGAQTELKDQFRRHTTGRYYLAVAHGEVHDGTLHFRLIRNRGDGLRGVTFEAGRGTPSVTHVRALQPLRGCTLVRCQLDTGRTHQIRIHLAQIGHPLVGDPLYTKGYAGALLDCSRTLLHAALLSFRHPVHRTLHRFEEPPPPAFEAFVKSHQPAGEAPEAFGRHG